MTIQKIEQLIAYYNSSKNILQISVKNSSGKIDQKATDFAIGLFDDVLSILHFLEKNVDILDKIVETNKNPLESTDINITEDR